MKTWKKRALSLIAAVLAVFMSCEQPHGSEKNKTPTAADFDISGTGEFTYDGNPKTVTVTAKEGKTGGKITVKYDGDTAAPSAVGAYTVTFDVAAAKGWNPASGLSAGTLTINAVIPGNQTPAAGDYDFDNLTQTVGSTAAVTVTPKEGKAAGSITVYYEGTNGTVYAKSTTPPTAAGTYAVTFDVAAANGWNAASGLSAGNLVIDDPNYQTPAASDYNISGTGTFTYNGGAKAVTVTPKPGKSTGAVTVKYNNSTAVPSDAGTYTVTFDVATANGWNPASGLSAGNLTISNATPTASDYEFGKLTQTAGNVSAVTITPKEGKSTGEVTIFYNGSATLPTAAGAYPVTFNVAAVKNWNLATGLSAGNLDIGNPNYPTPAASDYDIGNLSQTFGNVTAVTIKAKEGKSTGEVTVEYNNSTAVPSDAGTYTVTFNVAAVSGWNPASSLSAGTLTISPKVITFTVDPIPSETYNGGAITPNVTVKDGSAALTLNTHYTVSYGNNINAGTATVYVSGAGNYAGSTGNAAFTINPKATTFTIDAIQNQNYNGSAYTPAVTVKDGSATLTLTTDYTVSYNNNTNVGTAAVTVSGAGNYAGSSGNAVFTITNAADPYIITGTNESFTATKSGVTIGTANQVIQSVVDAIKTNAAGNAVTTQLGNGTDVLDIGSASASFNNTGGTWGLIALTGKITSSNTTSTAGTVVIADAVSITSTADIANTGTGANGRAVYNNSVGTVTISSGTVSATTGVAVYNNSTGKIIVSGTTKVTSAITGSFGTIYLADSGTATAVRLEISDGTVENTASGRAVFTNSTGTVNISGGTVSATTGIAVSTNSTGTVNISGGTVSATTGTAVSNYSGTVNISGGTVSTTTGTAVSNSSGTVNISGGTVSAITGVAVVINSTGKVTVSETALVKSAGEGRVTTTSGNININLPTGTIFLADNGTSTTTRLEIKGGTIENTSGNAVYNYSTGAVSISGGTISAADFPALYIDSTGKITVSGTAKVTSANTNSTSGTIYLENRGTATTARLEISGGTVENTASSGGKLVYNNSPGGVTISGGTVSATTGVAVYNNSTGKVTISGGAVSATTGVAVYNNSTTGQITVSGTAKVTSANTSTDSGTIYLANSGTATTARLEISGGTLENTALSGGKSVYNNSIGGVTITGGTVSATNGISVYNNSTGKITVSGTAKVTSANTSSDSGTIYLANSGTATTARLEISGGTVENTASSGGKLVYNNSPGGVTISGSMVSSTTGIPVYNNSTGWVTISGGTVSAAAFPAVYNASTGKITVSGTAKVTSANNSTDSGTIYIANNGTDTATRLEISGGTVENTGGKSVYNNSTGGVTISGGTVSAISGYAVYNNNTGWVTISGGTVSAPSAAVYNNNTGTVNISGGTVSAISEAVMNYYGEVNISGGTVSATSAAVYNNNTGTVNISGGTVSATTGFAVQQIGYNKITVSGTAKVTSANTDSNRPGTILITETALTAGNTVRLEITGGTVENTASSGGVAVYHSSAAGKIIVSGTAKVTSANTSSTSGTIYITNSQSAALRLEITGGTVENTSIGDGCAIYCVVTASSGTTVSITGGTVTKSGTATSGYAVYATINGKVFITSGATITGRRFNC